jgi:hypothetical protein
LDPNNLCLYCEYLLKNGNTYTYGVFIETNELGLLLFSSSVPDPNPDPHVFGPPGSQFISQRSGSGSFYQQAKKVKKNLDSYCFVTSFGPFIFEK